MDLLRPADDSAWDLYFDELEQSALQMDEDVRLGRPPAGITVPTPAGELPMRLQARSHQVLELLDGVMARAQAHRDQVAADLAALPRARAVKQWSQTSLGGSLDITG